MQWLYEGSDEAPDVPGLGVLAGRCRLLRGDPAQRLKIPHVGWNALDLPRPLAARSTGLDPGAHVYFTHSYAAPVTADCVASTTHAESFAAAVEREQRLRRAVPSGEVERRRAPDPPQLSLRDLRLDADQTHHRVHGRARRTGRQGRPVPAAAARRRPGGARPPLQRRGDRRGRRARHHRDARKPAGAGADHQRRRARDLPAADRRRRHPRRRAPRPRPSRPAPTRSASTPRRCATRS